MEPCCCCFWGKTGRAGKGEREEVNSCCSDRDEELRWKVLDHGTGMVQENTYLVQQFLAIDMSVDSGTKLLGVGGCPGRSHRIYSGGHGLKKASRSPVSSEEGLRSNHW